MEIESVKEALHALLNSGNVCQVIYIDDVFAFRGMVEVEQALGWFSEALKKSPEKAIELVPVPYPVPDEDIWRAEFRQKWEQLDSDRKIEIINSLSKVLNSQLGEDEEVASRLKQLFPDKFSYIEVSPPVWRKQKNQILANIPENSRIICLFDQDLSAEEGFSNTGTSSGGGLLKELIDSHEKSNLLCGIFSHTISSTEAEHQHHRTFASEYQINVQKFLPLAKARLEKPIKFVDGFKKLLLHELCGEIKQSALKMLDDANTTALKKIQELDIYAFDRMVIKSAHQANEWEIETIVRLFQIYQRNEVRQRLANSEVASSLGELIVKARPTSQVETVIEEYIYPTVRKIRREELYDKLALIKHRPIETGDIFVCNEGSSQQKSYIVLAQPCDLAVRLNGTRVKEFVSLVPINKVNKRSSKKKVINKEEWKNYWSTRTVLDNFFDKPEELAVLEFKDSISVKTSVLDLAVLDPEGFCKIDVSCASPPPHLTEGWQILLKHTIDFYAKLNTKLRQVKQLLETPEVDSEVGNTLWEAVLPGFSFPLILPQVCYDNGIFNFGLRRIERYRQPGADGLLKAYTQVLSREAKEFDFSN